MFRVNNRNTRARCETCSRLTIKGTCSRVSIVNFEHVIASWATTSESIYSYPKSK